MTAQDARELGAAGARFVRATRSPQAQGARLRQFLAAVPGRTGPPGPPVGARAEAAAEGRTAIR